MVRDNVNEDPVYNTNCEQRGYIMYFCVVKSCVEEDLSCNNKNGTMTVYKMHVCIIMGSIEEGSQCCKECTIHTLGAV